MQNYEHLAIEQKWQKYWEENQSFAASNNSTKPKFYALDMFPFPSGAGLHVGHPEGYTATDIISRLRRRQGYEVLHPMGWDAFGLPAENFAIKTGVHPKISTAQNIENFTSQIKNLGFSYDWNREIDTTDPKYYKWSQWIFNQLFKKGLAYEKQMTLSWCPDCKIVAANEEVQDGVHERCGQAVEKREMTQWMLKITQYADRLLDDLDDLDWTDSIKEMQRNWIGKSYGAEVDFKLAVIPGSDPESSNQAAGGSQKGIVNDWIPDQVRDDKITVYTTRPDTLFGCTYMVLAPEHKLIEQITTAEQKAEVEAYVQHSLQKSERERKQDEKEKTGVFTGAYAINPVNGEKLAIWVADYVLIGYGTGAIMAVPAHDERDFEFAEKFGIEIKEVVEPVIASEARQSQKGQSSNEAAYEIASSSTTPRKDKLILTGKAKNSGFLDGLETEVAKTKMFEWLEENKVGTRQTNYRLRDWVFTRQRYWGEPIPLVHAEDGKVYTLCNSELPLVLPESDNYQPTADGKSPLANLTDWVNVEGYFTEAGDVKIVKAGEQAPAGTTVQKFQRETSTMPNWAGSSWYWLRYMDPTNTELPVGKDAEAYWQQVDLYVGGAEHAVLHLLYARFWHKVLFDLGIVTTKEPFQKLVNQGMILAFSYKNENGKYYHPDDTEEKNGEWFAKDSGEPLTRQIEKMSKSKSNVVNPDDVVNEYGADTLRMYEMFMGPFDQTVVWDVNGVVGIRRFLDKVWKLRDKVDFKEKKAIIIHGFGSACNSHWIPQVREQLIEKGYNVLTPSMPNPESPKYEDWKKVLDALNVDENTTLIGHSLGGGFIPRYLSETGKKVAKIVLVAPTYTKLDPAIDKEFAKDFDAEKVKGLVLSPPDKGDLGGLKSDQVSKPHSLPLSGEQTAAPNSKTHPNIFLLHTTNDPYISQEEFKRYTKELNPSVVVRDTEGHLGGSNRYLAMKMILNNAFEGEESKTCALEKALHKTIKKVSADTEDFKFNTAISSMMVLVNEFSKAESIPINLFEDFLFILNPYAPHITEELWSSLGHLSSLMYKPWPVYNEELCKEEFLTLVVQVNGKVRDKIEVSPTASKEEVLALAKASEKVQAYIKDGLKKEIYVPGKLVSLVV